jgi:hypothetical protein
MRVLARFALGVTASVLVAISSDLAYFGQTPPGDTPAVFAPGIISLATRFETYPTFSPDLKTMVFSVVDAGWTRGRLLATRLDVGGWSEPAAPAFSDGRSIDWESSISPDGRRMFFASNRPPSSGMDIWMVERASGASWSAPVRLPEPVNSAAEDGSPCVTNTGTLYFKSRRTGGTGGSWLYRAVPRDGAYDRIESLGNIIKTGAGETEPYVSPDESYLIFISRTRTGGRGGWDLWISFRGRDGSWAEPVSLGPDINSADDEYGPRVTPDGRYLFFTREKPGKAMDIYWVSTNVIDRLRAQRGISPPADSPDRMAESLAGYQAGDARAFGEFHASLRPLLAAHLLWLGAEEPTLDRLLDRVFLQIHAARRTWRPGSAVQPWATAIAQHVFQTEHDVRPSTRDA